MFTTGPLGLPSLGYEPYDVCLCRLASSLIIVLTTAEGRRVFMPGTLRLHRLNPSRSVSCTNPCINLVDDPGVSAPSSGGAWRGSGRNARVAPDCRLVAVPTARLPSSDLRSRSAQILECRRRQPGQASPPRNR
jgi:hypothetical protein